MNDPTAVLRNLLRQRLGKGGRTPMPEPHAPDAMQMLAAEMLLFTGLGTAAETLRTLPATGSTRTSPGERPSLRRLLEARPIAWAPAVLGPLAALAHAVHAVAPTGRTRLATRTMDMAVVGAGLLGVAETLAAARNGGELPSTSAVALASAGLLGLVIDRADGRHEAERRRLQRRADLVERLVPRRRPRLDHIVVHV